MASRNRGQKKPHLRDLHRTPPTTDERLKISNELTNPSPAIVVAVLGQALVEIELEALLRRRFARDDQATWDMLTDEKGPLNTFYSKIVAGYAFRFYNEAFRDNLHIIRNVRNAFAHAKRPLEFEHALLKRELSKISFDAKIRKRSLGPILADKSKGFPPDMVYVGLCMSHATHLLAIQARQFRSLAAYYKRKNKKWEEQRRSEFAKTLNPFWNAMLGNTQSPPK